MALASCHSIEVPMHTAPHTQHSPEYSTVDEVAIRLRHSTAYVRRLLRERRIVGTRLGRKWLIESTEVNRLLSAARMARSRFAPI